MKKLFAALSSNINWCKKAKILLTVVSSCSLGLCCFQNAPLTCVIVIGESMLPTCHPQDTCFVIRYMALQRNDLAVYYDGEAEVIKRVIGTPGDWVQITPEGVYINQQKIQEPYTTGNTWIHDIKHTNCVLLQEQYFMMGDNRNVSWDSRFYGPVHIKQIKGRVL